MHTSSGVDAVDEFAETIVRHGRHGCSTATATARAAGRRVDASTCPTARPRRQRWRSAASPSTARTTARSCARQDGKWISIALMNKPVEALSQSFLRTKASDYAGFLKVAELKANSSNNTIFADAKGDIAYLHPQFIPRRDDRFDYTKPGRRHRSGHRLEGPARRWTRPRICSIPPNGWIVNTNNWPYSAAGAVQPATPADFPRYMDRPARTRAASTPPLVLKDRKRLHAAVADRRRLRSLSARLRATDPDPGCRPTTQAPDDDPLKAQAGRSDRVAARLGLSLVGRLRGRPRWRCSGASSCGASRAGREGGRHRPSTTTWPIRPRRAEAAGAGGRLDRLAQDFGSWRTPWGEINRFQRVDGDIVADSSTMPKPSIAGAVHLGPMGLARLVRRAPLPGHQALLRHARATASSPWSNSATRYVRARSPSAARAAIRLRRTSTTRR